MKQSPSFEANSSSTIQEFPETKEPEGSLTHSQQPATCRHSELPLTTRKDAVIKYSNCTTYTTSLDAALYVTPGISHLLPFLPSSQLSTEHYQKAHYQHTHFRLKTQQISKERKL